MGRDRDISLGRRCIGGDTLRHNHRLGSAVAAAETEPDLLILGAGGEAKPLKQPEAEKKEYDEVNKANLQKKKYEEKIQFGGLWNLAINAGM